LTTDALRVSGISPVALPDDVIVEPPPEAADAADSDKLPDKLPVGFVAPKLIPPFVRKETLIDPPDDARAL
jgi:hypothetical protein